jgi:hypothetical protein
MPTPLNMPRQPAAASEEGRTKPPDGRSDLSPDERSALQSLGAELLRRAQESQPVLEASWDELLAKWGVHGRPVGIQRLREMIEADCGTRPEDNAFSRELITLREEGRP